MINPPWNADPYAGATTNFDDCGIDLLQPYCTSACPEDCMSGQWENVHWKENEGGHNFELEWTQNNVVTIECGKKLISGQFKYKNLKEALLHMCNVL